MHLTRPKSSKGRSRPAVSSSGDADGIQRESAEGSRPDRDLRSRSQPVMWPAGQLSRGEVLHLLQAAPGAPGAPPQSLNKYKVLPSIERRQSEASLDGSMSRLGLGEDAGTQRADRPPDPPTVPTTEAGAGGGLLLAVRAPCGSRFQQHFDPADTLQAVRASAEARYGARYGEAFIQTVDVPRRTFTDLDVTLAQCGIPNRSVLCICQRTCRSELQ